MNRTIATLALGIVAFVAGVFVERHIWGGASESIIVREAERERAWKGGLESERRSNEVQDEQMRQSLDLGTLRKAAARSHGDSHAVRRALHGATREQIRALAAGMESLDSDDPNDRALKVAILHRMADLDPQGALAAVLSEDFRVQSDVIHHVFRQLSRLDFAGAKLAASKLENRVLRQEAIRAIAHEIGSEDPIAVAGFLESQKDAREFGDFFEHWAGNDPAEASRYVGNVEDSWKRREWIRSVARGWARRSDPAAALTWAKSLSSGRERAEAIHSIAGAVADVNPPGAAPFVDELPADHMRRDFVEHLARTWAEQDLSGALKWAESLGGTLRSEAIEALLPAWVREDAASAAAYVELLPASERHLHSLKRVAESWSRIDKESALAWAGSQENPAAKGQALGGIAHAWAREDPQAASEMMGLLDYSEDRLDVLDEIARSWSRSDLGLALEWAEALPTTEQERAYRGLLDNVAEVDPAGAAGLYSELAGSSRGAGSEYPEAFPGMAGHIAERWSQYDPANAAEWALGLSHEETQRHAVERVADQWLRADPLRASEWIGQLEEGRVRDVAAERLVDQIAESDPDAALQWALTAQDLGHQTDMLRHVYERWQRSDPTAAQQSFNSAPVSAEQREELKNLFD